MSKAKPPPLCSFSIRAAAPSRRRSSSPASLGGMDRYSEASWEDWPIFRMRSGGSNRRSMNASSGTDSSGSILPTTADALGELTGWLIAELALPANQIDASAVAVRTPVFRKTHEAPEPELLNSFFLGDLTRVRQALQSEEIGLALRRYLKMSMPPPRRDVNEDRHLIRETVGPARVPLARWPPKGGLLSGSCSSSPSIMR